MSNTINLLFIGDIVGKSSLNFLLENLETLKNKYHSNFIVVNGENTDEGKGINEEQANSLFDAGVNIITTGNHIWDNWKSRPLLAKDDRVLRPNNYPPGNAGRGFKVLNFNEDIKIAVIQLQGRTFMPPIDCPFRSVDNALKNIGDKTKVIIVDFHADATAEKISMGWHLDGRVSAVLGTHTHIQTADATILNNGTAYITDVGMTGPYDSVVGMKKDISLKRFILQTAHKYEIAEKDFKISGASVQIDCETGQAMQIESFMYPKFITSVYEDLNSK